MHAQPSRRVRNKNLHDHLQHSAAQRHSTSSHLATGLAYETTISHYQDEENEYEDSVSLPGGLTKEDVMRYAYTPLKLDSRSRSQLSSSLKESLRFLSEFWEAGEDQNIPEGEKSVRALCLPEKISERQAQIQELQEETQTLRPRIIEMVKEVNEIHPRLEQTLTYALETFPPLIQTERFLQAEVLSNSIESCLLKLSLLRYRSHVALYSFTTTSAPPLRSTTTNSVASGSSDGQATMSRALENMYEKLHRKEIEQEEEEKELDRQIEEYETLLSFVDGPDRERGSFRRVVKDMALVRKETEECRRDLKRLGWTGD